MAIPFPNMPSWLWRSPSASPSPPPPPPSSLDLAQKSPPSFSPRPSGRRRWHKPRRPRTPSSSSPTFDPDFDLVLVPPDSACAFSASDSDDSDWSVGWFEPHAPDFCSDGEPESSFAVLVPCYGSPSPDTFAGRGRFNAVQEDVSKSQLWAAVLSNIAKDSKAEGSQYLQQWLSSLQG